MYNPVYNVLNTPALHQTIKCKAVPSPVIGHMTSDCVLFRTNRWQYCTNYCIICQKYPCYLQKPSNIQKGRYTYCFRQYLTIKYLISNCWSMIMRICILLIKEQGSLWTLLLFWVGLSQIRFLTVMITTTGMHLWSTLSWWFNQQLLRKIFVANIRLFHDENKLKLNKEYELWEKHIPFITNK